MPHWIKSGGYYRSVTSTNFDDMTQILKVCYIILG